MSSPFGHSIAGYFVAVFETRTWKVINLRKLISYIFIANAADLDLIPGFIIGKPNLFHHGASHSLCAAVLFSIAAAFFMGSKEKHYIKMVSIAFCLYVSHLFFDYLSVDGRPPIGIPVFWPLSNEYFIFPYPFLPPVMHSSVDHATTGQFLNALFSIHNLYVMLIELAVTMPLLIILIIPNIARDKHNRIRLKNLFLKEIITDKSK